MLRIGIDLGGTNIAGGLVSDDGEIVFKKSISTVTDKGESGLLDAILSLCKSLIARADSEEITSIGIGVPGHADNREGLVVYCNNIPFENTCLSKFITENTGLSCNIGNDANAAALAEVLFGVARGLDSAIMVTLGTGVGGGIIIGKRIFDGCNGSAGEIGHMSLFPDGKECNCGRRGCFELYASATALKEQTQKAMENHPESKLWEFAKSPLEANGKTAFDAMRAGDDVGKSVVEQYIKYLSVGIVNLVNCFCPEAIIFGGGIAKEGETLLSPIREILSREQYSDYNKKTALLTASLGNDAGIIGAAFLGE